MTEPFGTLIKRERERAGITIAELAQHLAQTEVPGLPWGPAERAFMIRYLRTVESGRNYPPTPVRVTILCDRLQPTPEVRQALLEAAVAGQPQTAATLPVAPVQADPAKVAAFADQMLARDAQRK